MKGNVLNLGNLNFDIVSTVRCPVENFVLSISVFTSLGISTLVVSALQIQPFLCKTNPISKNPGKRNRFTNNHLCNNRHMVKREKRTQTNPIKPN